MTVAGSRQDLFEAAYPLSPLQEGMLFHSEEGDVPGLYVSQVTVDLDDIDEAAFRNAWERLMQRHEVLRAAFAWETTARPMQVIVRELPVPLSREKWGADGGALEERWSEFLEADRRRGFDLAKPPLMRLHLVDLPGGGVRWLWTFHHLLFDGWSSSLLFEDLVALYRAEMEGRPAALPPAPRYRDFIAWLEERDLEADEVRWRAELAGYTSPVEPRLPVPERPGAGMAKVTRRLSRRRSDRLRELVRQHGWTLSSVMAAVWGMLLAVYSGREDLVFGMVLSGRPPQLDGVERTVGMFINTVPLRLHLPAQLRASDLLAELTAHTGDLLELSHTPLAAIQRWSEVPPGTPLFDTLLTFENFPLDAALETGSESLGVRSVKSRDLPHYPLGLSSWPDAELPLLLDYDSRRYEPMAARRVLDHVECLLGAIVEDPDRPFHSLSLLSPLERHQVLHAWNDSARPAPGGAAFEPILEQARRQPEAVAVAWEGGELSFAALADHSARWARRLAELGAGTERPVVLLGEHSVDAAVALLGILRSASFCVLLDPSQPPARLAALLAEVKPAAVLSPRRLRSRLPDLGGCPWLDFSRVPKGPATPPAPPPGRAAAYAAFTSGSTGRAKGVVVTHASLLNFTRVAVERFALEPEDRFLQFSPWGFNVVFEELWPAWTSGASVVFDAGVGEASCLEVHRRIGELGVTAVELPAGWWQQWTDELSAEGRRPPAGLRLVLLGCEKPDPGRVDTWLVWGVRLLRVFGLTETTITSSLHAAQAGDGGDLPIGRPIANHRLYVLDRRLRPVPPGVGGELFVAGAGLARGYLGQPARTAERFLPDPFARCPGQRLYRTGDLVRHRADGSLKMLGRLDQQLKLRGFRIEAGEVEAALARHPGIAEAAVGVERSDGSGQCLVAYWAERSGVMPEDSGRRLEWWPSHGEYPIYDDLLYAAMTEDEVRNRAYRRALAQAAPGTTVLDLGTGADATLARLAVEAGARRVHAVEVLEESYRRARRRIADEGMEDRVDVILGDAADLELPGPVGVCLSEIIGCIGGAEGASVLLAGARRWLLPGGVMIPASCRTRTAAVQMPAAAWERPVMPALAGHMAQRVLDATGRPLELRMAVRGLTPADLVTTSGTFEELDFTGGGGAEQSHEMALEVQRAGVAHGLLCWIELNTGAGEVVDSLRQETSWLPLFLPAFGDSVAVEPGDVLHLTAHSELSDDGVHPDYRVEGWWERAGGPAVSFSYESPHHRPPAERSAWHLRLLPEEALAAGRVPLSATSLDPRELRAFLRRCLPAHAVPQRFVQVEELPRTSHGKVDRRALAGMAARHSEGAEYRPPGSAVEEALTAIWEEVLGVPRVGVDDDFFELGGDSIQGLQIVARARRAGWRITPRQIFRHPTVATLAGQAEPEAPAVGGGAPRVSEGPLPLTPIQHWFFGLEMPRREHWNLPLSLLLEGPPEPLDPCRLARAAASLGRRHDALGLRFHRSTDGRWSQETTVDPAVPLHHIDLAGLPSGLRDAARRAASATAQRSLDLAGGPLLRFVLFTGCGRHLLGVAHHLAVDAVSWRILLEDLWAAYGKTATASDNPSRSASFREYAEALEARRRSLRDAEVEAWRRVVGGEVATLPVQVGDGVAGSVAFIRRELPAEVTEALLRRAPEAYRAEPEDLLLAALGRALLAWVGDDLPLLVDVEGHGRQGEWLELDLSRTIGWLTSIRPLRMVPGELEEAGPAIRNVKERRRRFADEGRGYGLLLHTGAAGSGPLAGTSAAEVAFNYLGRLGEAGNADAGVGMSLLDEPLPAADPDAQRGHRWVVNAAVAGGRLAVEWAYDPGRNREAFIAGILGSFLEQVDLLVEHCLRPGAGGPTPSDFPLLELSPEDFDRELAGDPEAEDAYPLSPVQRGMLYHHRMAPEAGAYVAQRVFELRGELDRKRFRGAWSHLLRRHGVLRSFLRWRELEEPIQVVSAGPALPWREEDWEGLPEAERRVRQDGLVAEETAALRLDRAPLMRFASIRLGPRHHRFVWVYHQALFDGWSLPILLEELFADYRGEGGPAPAPPPYARFIAWLAERDEAEAETWWRQALAGAEVPTPLPALADPEPAEREEFADAHLSLPRSLSRSLAAAARRWGVTVNTAVQGAWALVLSRYADRREVVFGVTVSGRPAEIQGIERMVGLFINTLPARIEVPEDGDVAGWLRGLQDQQAEMRRFEHNLLTDVRRWAGLPAERPLFESILVFENYPMERALEAGVGDLRVEPLLSRSHTHYPLTLVAEVDSQLRFKLTHDRRRVGDRGASLLLAAVARVLEGMVAAPRSVPTDLPVLDSGTADRSGAGAGTDDRAEAPGDTAAGGRPRDFPGRLAERCRRRPGDLAVEGARGGRMTFAELDSRSRSLALRLRAGGVERESVVGVYWDRSIDAVVALVAVLRAGGAFLPLAPDQPPAWRHRLLGHSAARWVLVPGDEPIDAPPDVTVVRVGSGDDNGGEGMADGALPRPLPGQLAYVLHTSGTTGSPNGVMVPHEAWVHLCDALGAAVPAAAPVAGGSPRRVGLNATLTFDSSLKAVVQLLNGATLVPLPEEVRADPVELSRWLAGHPLDVLDCTPSQLVSWLDGAALAGGGAPNSLMVGGEAVPPELWRRLADAAAPRSFNLYGPTETTVDATVAPVEGSVPHLGRPLSGVRVYVVDRLLRRQPPGATGELAIAGRGVSRGYLGDPRLTAARFVPDPFGDVPGGRLYLSGDRGRRDTEGRLLFAGRVDHQVKVRGARLEYAVVEGACESHPGVARAVAAVTGDGVERRLVAYLVPAGTSAANLDLEAVRLHLLRELPAYAVPQLLVPLEDLPRTPHGKVDRAALPRPSVATGGMAPRSKLERELADIWAEVLGIDEVGVDQDFFALGGHSLLATRLISRLRRSYGVDVPLRDLFAASTVSGLATVVARLRASQVAPERLAELMRGLGGPGSGTGDGEPPPSNLSPETNDRKSSQ